MDFENLWNQSAIEIVKAIIEVAIPAAASIGAAYITAKYAIKKEKLNWDKKDLLSADAMMQAALSSAALCACDEPLLYRDQALACIAPLLCRYSGRRGDTINSLYLAVADNDWPKVQSLVPLAGRLYIRRKNWILRLIDHFSKSQ